MHPPKMLPEMIKYGLFIHQEVPP
jgi:hypothetical protein